MASKKKVVLLLGLHDNDAREKRKVLKAVSALPGLDLISVDMKASKLTVVGMVDPIELVTKLRKLWHAEILSVGPAKEDKQAAGAAGYLDMSQGGADVGGVEEGDYSKHRQEVAAEQVVMERPADMRSSWPQAVVYPALAPQPYPYQPHQYGGAGGNGARLEDPRDYYVAAGGGLGAAGGNHHPNSYVRHGGHGARENHQYPNPGNPYVAHGHGGARRNQPNSYGARQDPNACAIF